MGIEWDLAEKFNNFVKENTVKRLYGAIEKIQLEE